jgi:hypothetical protein
MNDRQRKRAFAFSALFTVVVCALVWVVERPRSGHTAAAEPATQPRRPVVVGGEAPEAEAPAREGSPQPPPQGSSPPREGGPLAGKAQIEATARRFTGAFVEYEVGRLPTQVRQQIQSTATLSFASSLLSAPPRIPNGMRPPPPARIREAALANGPEAGQAAVAVELRSAGGEISTLTELLSRSGREWRVSGLG